MEDKWAQWRTSSSMEDGCEVCTYSHHAKTKTWGVIDYKLMRDNNLIKLN